MNDPSALRPGAAVGEALRTATNNVLTRARAALADPAKPEAQAVHDFRRAAKRCRALLRLVAPFVGEEARRLRHEARDLARALAGARDAQAALDALDDLEKHGLALSVASVARIRWRIEKIRQAAETTLDAGMRRRLVGTLDRAQATVESWPLHEVTYDQLADRLTRFYRRARRLLPADWTTAQADELHALRSRVVVHRYQMDIVEPLWPRFARMWTGEAQRLRERLGKHQDLLMLARLTAPRQPLARWRSRLAPAIDARRAVHVAAAARIAARLLVEKSGSFRRRLAAMWDAGG